MLSKYKNIGINISTYSNVIKATKNDIYYLSCLVNKLKYYDGYIKTDVRNFLVTNRAVYNFKPTMFSYECKRRIPI